MNTMEEFIQLVKDYEVHCFTCQTEIVDITYYSPHDGGITYMGEKVWAYLHCPKCGYDTSFPKVEAQVDREQAQPRAFALKDIKVYSDNPQAPSPAGPSKPWKGVCCFSCWFAKRKPCKCRCKRANHQRGIQKVMTDYPIDVNGGTFIFRGPTD